ncbi:MAG: hypothetical protein WA208_09120 [Thermoanaerobaculia bacterium]
MRAPTMFQAVVVSSLTCAAAYAATSLLLGLLLGKGLRLEWLAFAIPLAIAAAISAAFVQWPILRWLRTRDRRVFIAAGALLALVPFLALVLLMEGLTGEEPLTVASLVGLVRFWFRVPGEFLVGFVPLLLAGATLGWFAAQRPVVTTE